MKTFLPKDHLNQRNWHIVDADGMVLGRLARTVANVLRGKNKPTFTPHLDCGDFVVIVNAEKVRLTGKKEVGKIYHTYSGWRGGEKITPANKLREKHPEKMIERAVKGMLPKGRLGSKLYTKLNVYKGAAHPHAAQNPAPLEIKD
ncbi:MAG: 50S ribosomal protein L13 [Verrucomicrobiae bacterium]|jgi:large subunit ribosomal protein L13|nr:50S ribosomal protein L13 [Verrucomicrobiae bacterium]